MSKRSQEVENVENAVAILRDEHPDLIRCPMCHEVIAKVNGGLPEYYIRGIDLCYTSKKQEESSHE